MDAGPAAAPEVVDRLATLQATVWRYVRRRRNAGVPVQQVLPEVEALVREAFVRERATGEAFRDATEVLRALVARWSVAAYYALHYESAFDRRDD